MKYIEKKNSIYLIIPIVFLLFSILFSCNRPKEVKTGFICNTEDVVVFKVEVSLYIEILDDGIGGEAGETLDLILRDTIALKAKTFIARYISKIDEKEFYNDIKSKKIESITTDYLNKLDDTQKYIVRKIIISAQKPSPVKTETEGDRK